MVLISDIMAAFDAPRSVGSFFHHLLQLKQEGSLDNLPGFVEAGALQILSLKQVHRELCEATEGLRDATSEAKTQLDQSSLQLQNLLYEQQHYEKEIESCRAYQSAYPGGTAIHAASWACSWPPPLRLPCNI